jgi:ATP phosphoribosyltransferase regulatory subunit
MTAETTRAFEALQAQAQRLMSVFTQAGFEAVAPAVIQPAGVFLDCVGEALRARTYVFTDPDGTELCLRPDLTVPTCRLHLERSPDGGVPARYCYNGNAFRYQAAGTTRAHPREFRQAGIESFGDTDAAAAEAETLAVMVEALDAAGLDRRQLTMKFGDLELVAALLDALDLPPRWRQRLKDRFWQPDAFRAELKRLASDPGAQAQALPLSLRAALSASPADAEGVLEAHLANAGIEAFGARTLGEVARNAVATLEDVSARPLEPRIAELIESYVALRTPSSHAVAQVAKLAARARLDLTEPLAKFDTRLTRFKDRGLDLEAATFSGNFGRQLEYYTGFVFEVAAPGLPPTSPVAGGGRYDRLMRLAGCPRDVPAVGAAIHTERLLSVIEGRH